VSFLVVSATAALAVSAFLAVSTVAAFAESAVFAESADEAVEEPLQAAKETATTKAKEAILNEFFIVCYILFFALIQQCEKGNPYFF
jgi:hypothetical protein